MSRSGKPQVLNFFAGPGSGKSTMAAAVFAELKFRGRNVELVTEYAKEATWENRSTKFFAAQEYIFGKQSFRISRAADQVDLVITDSPLLLSLVYMDDTFEMPSLSVVVEEAHNRYISFNYYVKREKAYNPVGRNQSSVEASALDVRIQGMLREKHVDYTVTRCSQYDAEVIANHMETSGVFE